VGVWFGTPVHPATTFRLQAPLPAPSLYCYYRAVNGKLLIDAIVHQTTILIAQLSTASGIRAPLAHVADQVFLELSHEIEAQGVSRKVAADMFGLAIRTYQKKVQRITETLASHERTLWQMIFDHVQAQGSCTRRELASNFRREDPVVVGSLLNDLVSSGLLYRSGTGDATIFGVTSTQDVARALREGRREALPPLVWVSVYRASGATLGQLREKLGVDDAELHEALANLEAQGKVRRTDGEGDVIYRAETFLVPVDSPVGWEAAVFDHFQTVVRAIGMKVRRGVTRSSRDDVVGGATLSFDIHADHPCKDEVLCLLRQVRAQANDLWKRVEEHNAAHPVEPALRTEVSFYFGQCVTTDEEEAT